MLQAFYWTISEFGRAAISDEECWMEVCIARSTRVRTFQGGCSALFSAILRFCFFNSDETDVQTAGIFLQFHDGTHARIWVDILAILADESALHQCWHSKGASGLKPCGTQCANVFNAQTPRAVLEADPEFAVLSTCVDPTQFIKLNKATILSILRRLQEIKDGGGDLGEAETRLGWSLVEGMILLDPVLQHRMDPTKHTMFDPMHVYFVSGIVGIHIGNMMRLLRPRNVTYKLLHTYAKAFSWPKRVAGVTGVDALGPRRSESSYKACAFKAQASEHKSLMPVLANFVTNAMLNHDDPVVHDHAVCFLRLVKVLDLIEASARGDISAATLLDATVQYMVHFKRLFGEEHMVIKHHLAFHIHKWLDELRYLPDCGPLERKHRVPKRYGDVQRNTSPQNNAYCGSVLRQVTARHIAVLRDDCSVHFNGMPCLQNPIKPSRKLLAALNSSFASHAAGTAGYIVSAAARCSEFEVIHKGDVVMLEAGNDIVVGVVELHFSATTSNDPITLLQEWELVSQRTRSSVWKMRRDRPYCCMTSDILYACIVCKDADSNTAEVLHPSYYRMR